MATLAEIGEALKRADAAGNVEDARRLAQAYATMKNAGSSTPATAADTPPTGAVPGSRAYADWAVQRARAGKELPKVEGSVPLSSKIEDELKSPGGKFNAAFTATVNSVPLIGSKMLEGAEALRAAIHGVPVEDVQRETRLTQEANPIATTMGNVTGTVAPFVLAATVPVVSTILGLDVGAPMAANMILGGASQKVISMADTAIRGGTDEPIINAGGIEISPSDLAAAGGVAGPLVGKGLGWAAKKGGEFIGDVGRGLQSAADPKAGAQNLMTKVARADVEAGNFMTPADEAAAALNGQPVINADRFGRGTQTLARVAANKDPIAAETLSETVQDRFLTQNARAADWVTRNTGAPTNVYAAREALGKSARIANDGNYRIAYNAPEAASIWNDEIADLMIAPSFRKAIDKATKTGLEDAALTGDVPVKNPFRFRKDGTYTLTTQPDGSLAVPSLKFWDYVQRNLRTEASKLARRGDADGARRVTQQRQALLSSLDEAVPTFKTARAGAAAAFGAEDALEAGQKFATAKLSDLPEAAANIAKFSAPEKRLFASGFASSLIDKIGRTGDTTNVINTVFDSPQAREQIRLALGARAAQELENFVRVEDIMHSTKRAVQSGSNTTQQQIAAGISAGSQRLGIGYGTGVGLSGGQMNPGNWNPAAWTAAALVAGGRVAAKVLGKNIDQKVMQEVAKALSSNDPAAIQRVIQNASRSSKTADAIKAIEHGVSTMVKGAGAGASAGMATAQPEMVN